MPTTPNLLILMVDQFQAQLLERHDLATFLPNLDALRRRSQHFQRCFCPAPICTPCRASMQLLQSVHAHGVIGNDRNMPAGPTIADRLAAAGYATSYVGKWHLDRGNGRGWQHFDPVTDWFQTQGEQWTTANRLMASANTPHEGPSTGPTNGQLDAIVRDRGLAEMQRLHQAPAPWALTVSFYGPHAPYELPAADYTELTPEAETLPASWDDPLTNKPTVQREFRCRAWGSQWDASKWRRIRAAYHQRCRLIDRYCGKLLNQLEALEAHTNTAVVLVADHGELNGAHRMIYKGPMMYEELVRVPALLSGPGVPCGANTELCDLTDLLATALGLCAVSTSDTPAHNYGLKLGTTGWGRSHVISEFHEANWVRPTWHQSVAMVRDQRWKLVCTKDQGEELYDLATDPAEITNRIASESDQANRLRALLPPALRW
ncbi:MAG: sulfatase-like hydrolase/transferase [Planctomycetota bacterium]|jgi:choline-sulfatase|nr:sulfatase-like hydrolase/transferase [Planctomycetota bacterium]